MDIIEISQLKVETIIGVYEFEKKIKRPLFIDIRLITDISAAAQSDDINHTIDYAALTTMISKHISNQAFELIETVAYTVADIVLKFDKVTQTEIRVSKPYALENATNVSVFIKKNK